MKENLERNACWFNWYSADPDCNPYVLIHRRLRGLLDRMAWRPRFWNCDAEVAREDEPPLVFAHLRRPTRFKHSLGETSNFTWLRDPALSVARAA
ncbi:unnamed protein product [Prorocentrum cordatum]|uniref:Uncharacterized protein n=1 Tax=Prorocentrum cordatum TaxID=2364126 RepID=A0ABN9SEL1_9DINO|nr:unnamed protein product [Polarella glacialis]